MFLNTREWQFLRWRIGSILSRSCCLVFFVVFSLLSSILDIEKNPHFSNTDSVLAGFGIFYGRFLTFVLNFRYWKRTHFSNADSVLAIEQFIFSSVNNYSSKTRRGRANNVFSVFSFPALITVSLVTLWFSFKTDQCYGR